MRHEVTLPSGTSIPALGIGTWHTAETSIPRQRLREIDAIQTGISAGMTLIDTAEMYSNGKSEQLVGDATRNCDRSKLFLTSKVYPWNAGREHIFASCAASLERLQTDYLDLYLLHWRGSVPLEETVECMEELVHRGMIRAWGVSNFDTADMEELWKLPNADHCQVDEVLYHVGSRGIEYSLVPWLRDHGVAVMAYCPLAQGGTLHVQHTPLLNDPTLLSLAQKHHVTSAQIMLAWAIRDTHTIAIPMSTSSHHMRQNALADDLTLDHDDLALLDEAFPAPTHKVDLATQ
ncbi:MAG: aldo/keto reductase [Bifidobacteriaceae bacterium]|jgi:diketogulonate reductase-like aldo/keto reductase|nr:aldo/keto reductase [Bifidobacteriaceae bacterium]MCI1914947.1 aldo/keto reductase [Bifidobacteriaceae bacterium]